MFRILLLSAMGVLTMVSCKKEESLQQNFIGTLPITSVHSPASVTAGQKIVSNITCELTSISGSVYFRGFDITEVSPRRYHIEARAFYKDWNSQVSLPVTLRIDTMATVTTSAAGLYILDFYNSTSLFQSDTIQVN